LWKFTYTYACISSPIMTVKLFFSNVYIVPCFIHWLGTWVKYWTVLILVLNFQWEYFEELLSLMPYMLFLWISFMRWENLSLFYCTILFSWSFLIKNISRTFFKFNNFFLEVRESKLPSSPPNT
jgi:hypothetical protein